MSNSETQKRTAYDNLRDQIVSVMKSTNVGSYATRQRYFDGTDRFIRYYAEEWNGQKFVNVSGKHIRTYVKYMQEKGLSPSMVRTELSSIRFFYDKAQGKNRLPDNRELGLEKRLHGTRNRAWLPGETEKAIELAKSMGRVDVAISISLGRYFGLRVSETAKLRVEHLTKALKYDELTVKGKGGQVRAIPVETETQKKLVERLLDYAKSKGKNIGDYLISSSEKRGVEKEIGSIKSWEYNHRDKFIDPNRLSKVAPGEKERIEKPSFHGYRHSYAQEQKQSLEAAGCKNADREVSERLGHHRPGITKDYLAEA